MTTQLTFVNPDGTSTTVEAQPGDTVMQVATRHGVEGIVAECGGSAMCGTCHVYVDEQCMASLPEPGDDEHGLLDFVASERRPTSRLSCQITVGEGCEKLVVYLPEAQQ